MMANIYGVVAGHAERHKGYSDFVQHTGTIISGQLRSSFSGVQTLPVTFGYSQTSSVRLTYRPRFERPKLERLANPLMGLNCRESRELAKHEQYSGSEVPTKSTGSWRDGADLLHEKGRTANATLWDDCFFNHEENQHSPVLDDGRKPNLAYEENQYLAEPQDNHTGISGEVKPWHRSVLQKFRKTSTGATYKTFVGDRVTGSKPVQPSGASLDFLRCLRLISPCMAVTMNWAVLSPSSLTNSTASATSCGTRALIFCDLLLMLFGDITGLRVFWWVPVYTKNNFEKGLKWVPLDVYSGCQLDVAAFNNSEAPVDCSPSGASNHNVNEAYTMACQHSTQTRPKFVFLFLGTPNEFPNTTPTVLRVEADTEDEGRAKFVGWTLIFAAQIRTEAPCRLQLFSTDEGFMWVYELRQSATEVCHA